jgi:hypothetical protein
MSRPVHLCSAGLIGAAALVLGTGCGGGGLYGADSSASSSSTSGTGAAGTAAGSRGEDFCTRAAGIDDRIDAALADLDGADPSLSDAIHQAADQLRAIEAPDAINADWTALAAGLDQMADAVASVDLTDPDSLAALDDAQGGLSSASKNVENYLRDECGINP